MKIALISNGPTHLPWTNQGTAMEILTYELARRLAINNEVYLYSQRIVNQKKTEFNLGILHRRFSLSIDRLYLFASSMLSRYFPSYTYKRTHVQRNPFFASTFYYLAYYIQIALDCRKHNFDIIHIHNLSQFVPLLKKFNPNAKIVLHLHMEWLTQLDKQMILKRLNNVDLILGCSEYISQKIRKEFPHLKNKCQTLHNGVDTNRFSVRKKKSLKKKKLLFVGRNSPEKGIQILLSAFQNILPDNPQLELIIVGPQGPNPVLRGRELILYLSEDPNVIKLESQYDDNFIQKALEKITPHTKNHISFMGFISRQELIKVYAHADIFVYPSIWQEPFGMPIVEAMAMSLPVIATRVGGIQEIIEDGKTGILIAPGDVKPLEEAIQKLILNKELIKSMGSSARTQVNTFFSWDQIANRLEDYYEYIL